MSSIIHQTVSFETDFPLNSTDPSSDIMADPEMINVEGGFKSEAQEESALLSTSVCSKDSSSPGHQQATVKLEESADAERAQVGGERSQKHSESGDDSTEAAHHPTLPPSYGSHHAHYAQYYHSYPHGHASYYYPHGHYYPPPPPHGQSSYPHASHHAAHYYAHYQPPPSYYAHPHYHYYSHPPPTTTLAPPELSPSKSGSTSSSSTNTGTPAEESTTSTISTSQSTIAKNSSGPYSAFTKTVSQAPSLKPVPKALKSATTTTTTASTNKNKRKRHNEPNNIFRCNNKRTKQLTTQSKAAAAAIAAKRAKTKEQARKEVSKTVVDRRSRKNAQSRQRAAKLKQRIAEIQGKDPKYRTQEEIATLVVFEERRQRKNGRSRERAMERKKEYERIIKIPEDQWTQEEKTFVQETMVAKFKKNEGDRLRRKKLKEDLSSTGSISSGWEPSSCKGKNSLVSNNKSKKPMVSSKSKDQIPYFVESNNNNEGNTNLEPLEHQINMLKDVPLTPVTQKEVFSLLESTPTNFFDSAPYSTKNATDCFSPNFILPSPSRKIKDLSAQMDVIDFDSLELHTDGTSILDPSMAMTIDDEVIYSPHLNAPALNETVRTNPHHTVPQLSSNVRLSPLNLPRRNRSQVTYDDDNDDFFPHVLHRDKFVGGTGVASKSIAVSFSVDTI